MKGCPSNQISKEVDEMVKIIGLEQKLNRYSMTLSGGQKRKLSVGIALIAGSKVGTLLEQPLYKHGLGIHSNYIETIANSLPHN